MKSNTVISINDGIIKLLQVSGSQKKLVTAVEIIDTSNQNDTDISRTLSAFIKQKKLKFTDSRVTLVIPRSRVILRHMVFPSQQEDEIRSMIDLQVGNRIPYAREEVEIDYQVLSKTAEGYSKVAVVIIPQDIAIRYWKIFSNSKIPIHNMTISSIGLWLLYYQYMDISEKPGAILDLDVNHSEICLCYKTHWLTSREIPVGFEQIQKDGYPEMLKQWELTQNNTGNEKLNEAVSSICLVAAANRAPTLGLEMAKQQNDLLIKEINLTQTMNLARGVHWPKPVTEDGASIASLAGIAFSPNKAPIDLIPRSVRLIQAQQLYQQQLIMLGVWGTMALLSLGLAFGIGYFKKNVQLAHLEEQLHDSKREALTVEKQMVKINDIEDIVKNRFIFSDLADEISRLLPAEVYLVSITFSDGNTLSLQGMSSNSIEINQFQKGMVDSPRFSNVSLDYVNKRVTQQGEIDYFKITCSLKSANEKNEKT